MKKIVVWVALAAFLAAALAGCGNATGAKGGGVSLLETGSTLLYPLFNEWVGEYQEKNPDVQITTQGTGSGAGISMAANGSVQIGASDAYVSDTLMQSNPGLLNIPLAVSAQQINYNVPGLNNDHLKLSGPVLAEIYSGKVLYWDDPAVKAMNPGVRLPHKAIIPVHRTDGSGDTFIFTQYLSFSTPAWDQSVHYGTNVSWPAVQGSIGAEGNPGMVQALEQNKYSIAYVGISWLDNANKAGLGEAELLNKNGQYVLPTNETISAAVQAMAPNTPSDARISLVFAPGENSYPIINYEYAIVNKKQPDTTTAAALKNFLNWALSPAGGESPAYLDQVHFLPLPQSVVELSKKLIGKIGS